VEHWLIGLGLDRTKPVHAAHIVDRIGHRAVSAFCSSGDSVPTMLSRVNERRQLLRRDSLIDAHAAVK
jgi:hypothetical protein